jgi:hypothetical protein
MVTVRDALSWATDWKYPWNKHIDIMHHYVKGAGGGWQDQG